MPVRLTGQSVDGIDLVFSAITANVNLTATSSATGTTAISTGAFTVDHTDNYWVEVFSPQLTKGTTNLDLELWDGGTSGTFLTTLSGHMTASSAIGVPCSFRTRVSLSAGSHTIVCTGFVDAGTGVFGAGDGATSHLPNAWIRVRVA